MGKIKSGRDSSAKALTTSLHKEARKKKWDRNRDKWAKDEGYQKAQAERKEKIEARTRKYHDDPQFRSKMKAEKSRRVAEKKRRLMEAQQNG